MKTKVILILFILSIMTFCTGLTYSVFQASTTTNIDQKIAKFVFDADKLDHLELQVDNMLPGDYQEYLFSVTNTYDKKSNVTLNYQMTIKTFHFMPLVIELYKIDNGNETLLMECNENYSRNDKNELVCNSEIKEMSKDSEVMDNYKLKLEFPDTYSSEEYANLVDFIDIEIKSWQKVEGE